MFVIQNKDGLFFTGHTYGGVLDFQNLNLAWMFHTVEAAQKQFDLQRLKGTARILKVSFTFEAVEYP